MGREAWTYTQDTEKELMKEVYGDLVDKQFNINNVIYSQIKKDTNFSGEVKKIAVEGSIGGSVFSSDNRIARGSRNKTLKAELRRTKHYGTTEIDRETMKVARGGASSFVNVTQYAVKTLTKSFARDMERKMVLGDLTGSGLLAVVDSVGAEAGTVADPLTLTLPATTVMAQFEEGDLLNIGGDSAGSGYAASALEVIEVIDEPSSKQIKVAVGDHTPVATDELYKILSEDNEFAGLQGILKATTGSYLGIDIQRRWRSHQRDASAAAVSTALINGVVVRMEKATGESPNLILASFEQYKALLDLHEDQKVYNLPSKDKRFKTTVGFSGIEVMTAAGAIPCIPSRFVPVSEIYFLNTSKMSLHCAPGGFEWMDEDGTVFLRKDGIDIYEARYGGYCDFYVNPHFQGILYNLSVPTL